MCSLLRYLSLCSRNSTEIIFQLNENTLTSDVFNNRWVDVNMKDNVLDLLHFYQPLESLIYPEKKCLSDFFFLVWLSCHHLVRQSYSENKKVEFIKHFDHGPDSITFTHPICMSNLSMRVCWDISLLSSKWRHPDSMSKLWKKGFFWMLINIYLNWNCQIQLYISGPKEHMFTLKCKLILCIP